MSYADVIRDMIYDSVEEIITNVTEQDELWSDEDLVKVVATYVFEEFGQINATEFIDRFGNRPIAANLKFKESEVYDEILHWFTTKGWLLKQFDFPENFVDDFDEIVADEEFDTEV